MEKAPSRRPRGRPPYRPSTQDRRAVEILAAFAIPATKIAEALEIGTSTLYRAFPDEIRRGAAKVESMLVGNLIRLSKGNDGTALKATMFALQCRFGWSPYAPRPATEAPMGKKEQARIDAEEPPDEESGWQDLVH